MTRHFIAGRVLAFLSRGAAPGVEIVAALGFRHEDIYTELAHLEARGRVRITREFDQPMWVTA